MLCQYCGERPATVHLTEIANGHKHDTHLCEVCAGEMQVQGFAPQMTLHNFLASLLKYDFGGGKYGQPETAGKQCEKCGIGEIQFVKQGLLGCSDCYPSFEERMEPLLRRIHGNTRHTGKVPERTGGRFRLVKDIENLKNQLKKVVAREEFEQAAQLRDQIRQLEKNLEEGAEGQ